MSDKLQNNRGKNHDHTLEHLRTHLLASASASNFLGLRRLEVRLERRRWIFLFSPFFAVTFSERSEVSPRVSGCHLLAYVMPDSFGRECFDLVRLER